MAELAAHPGFWHGRRWGLTASLLGVLLFLALSLSFGIAHRTPDHAIVLLTSEDCRRAFDDWGCRAIVARAQAIHANTAPNFSTRQTCEFAYGPGSCSVLKSGIIELPLFAPTMIAVAVTADSRAVLPLYLGPAGAHDAETEAGRAVYYHGRLIGRLSQPRVGGADTGLLTDRNGEPLTAASVRQLRAP